MNADQRRAIGSDQLSAAVYRRIAIEPFVTELGIYSLTALIERVLDEHYPAAIFGDGAALIPTWMSEHGGEDIEPGVRWAALLRHAIKEAFEKSA